MIVNEYNLAISEMKTSLFQSYNSAYTISVETLKFPVFTCDKLSLENSLSFPAKEIEIIKPFIEILCHLHRLSLSD